MNRLICFIFGHKPKRLNGVFYVVCLRCPAVLNYRTGKRSI